MSNPTRGRPLVPQADDAPPFARHLRRLRLARGLSLDALAARARVNARTLAYYEAGREPQIYSARKIAQALDTTIDAMME